MKQEEFDNLKILLLQRIGGLRLVFQDNKTIIPYYTHIEVFEDVEEEVLTFICYTNPSINSSDKTKKIAYQAKLRGNIAKYLGIAEDKLMYDDRRELLEGLENKSINDTLLVLRDTLTTTNDFSI